jgi:hypothetical protein
VLDAGANPNEFIMTGSYQTPLYGAVVHIDIMELLMSRGANPLLGHVDILGGGPGGQGLGKGNLMDALRQRGLPCMRGGE